MKGEGLLELAKNSKFKAAGEENGEPDYVVTSATGDFDFKFGQHLAEEEVMSIRANPKIRLTIL